ncbi:MAG: hypothetical protein A2Z14_01165 [Chloroflexi bacterium RBG_16_48_8]|nr:MAG: hypothetical protein A2Z14_01165 [Chloroflexi bacterium RBG_16_48_8]
MQDVWRIDDEESRSLGSDPDYALIPIYPGIPAMSLLGRPMGRSLPHPAALRRQPTIHFIER